MTQLSFIGLFVASETPKSPKSDNEKQTNDARLWGNFQRLPFSPAAVFQITVQ